MRGSRLTALAGFLVVAAGTHARADEPMFGYTNTTDLLPRGKSQVEQWLTLRSGQAGGSYTRIEGRSEAEYGLKDNLQLTLYLNYDLTHADRNSARGLTEGLGVAPNHDPARSFSRGRFDGVTGEAIWRITSPYLSPVGFAVLAEATAGPGEGAGRIRAILQKNFSDDTIVVAANLWGQVEHRPASAPSAVRPKVTTIEANLGASWRFRQNWSAALEYRHTAEWAGYGFDGTSQFTADYLGPTIHYGGRRWFATLTAMRQLHAAVHDPSLRALSSDGRVFGARGTRWDGVRFRLGRTF